MSTHLSITLKHLAHNMMEMLLAVCLLPFIPEVNKKCDKANSILLPMLLCGF